MGDRFHHVRAYIVDGVHGRGESVPHRSPTYLVEVRCLRPQSVSSLVIRSFLTDSQ